MDAPESLPAKVTDDPWHHWNDAKEILDRACRLDKDTTCSRLMGYVKKKLGREFRTMEGVSIAGEVTAHLDHITKDDDDFLDAMACVIEYCGQRIGGRGLGADGLGSRVTSPNFAKVMEHTCYRLMAMIKPENPRARYAFEMLKTQCEAFLDRLPPTAGTEWAATEEIGGPADE